MAVYWHPFLAEFLRQEYGEWLQVEEEVPLGEMPPRVDLILIRRDPQVTLPHPFNYLGITTLVEYKGPEDTAGQRDLVQLESYALLYQLREALWDRPDLTLWLVASRFAGEVSRPTGAQLAAAEDLGPGVQGGTLDGFPTFLIDLNGLPIEPSTLPLLMVAKGVQERELVEFLLDHATDYPQYVPHLLLLHEQMFEEVLTMRELTLEEIGVDPERLIR
ncbi:MAG TPA: hypothetical protein EYP85_01100, partial [Armatimonadetes bacterium]|nr:hypothetical protein [Armatimonadota bacterium]